MEKEHKVGEGTPSKKLKSKWKKSGKLTSLRKFGFSEKALAESWLDNKKGVHWQERNSSNVARIKLEKQATKTSRQKKK